MKIIRVVNEQVDINEVRRIIDHYEVIISQLKEDLSTVLNKLEDDHDYHTFTHELRSKWSLYE